MSLINKNFSRFSGERKDGEHGEQRAHHKKRPAAASQKLVNFKSDTMKNLL